MSLTFLTSINDGRRHIHRRHLILLKWSSLWKGLENAKNCDCVRSTHVLGPTTFLTQSQSIPAPSRRKIKDLGGPHAEGSESPCHQEGTERLEGREAGRNSEVRSMLISPTHALLTLTTQAYRSYPSAQAGSRRTSTTRGSKGKSKYTVLPPRA